jgi:hypothetical protein
MLCMMARLNVRALTMPARIALHQSDARTLKRHIGAGAHGDSNIGGGQT